MMAGLEAGRDIFDGPHCRGGCSSRRGLGWLVHVMTPTAHPLEALVEALNGQSSIQARIKEFTSTAQGLQRTLDRLAEASGSEHVLLVIDQFEELFTLCRNEDEQHAFVEDVLTAALQPGGKAIVVIAMRADFYAYCARFDLLRQAVSSHQEYIGPMSMRWPAPRHRRACQTRALGDRTGFGRSPAP